jgi:hypothetical protein
MLIACLSICCGALLVYAAYRLHRRVSADRSAFFVPEYGEHLLVALGLASEDWLCSVPGRTCYRRGDSMSDEPKTDRLASKLTSEEFTVLVGLALIAAMAAILYLVLREPAPPLPPRVMV